MTPTISIVPSSYLLSSSPHLLNREGKERKQTERRERVVLHCETNFVRLVRNFYRGSPSEPESRTVLRGRLAGGEKQGEEGGGQGCMINECTNNTMNISEGEDAKWCLEMQRLSSGPFKSHEVPKHKLPAKCMIRKT